MKNQRKFLHSELLLVKISLLYIERQEKKYASQRNNNSLCVRIHIIYCTETLNFSFFYFQNAFMFYLKGN